MVPLPGSMCPGGTGGDVVCLNIVVVIVLVRVLVVIVVIVVVVVVAESIPSIFSVISIIIMWFVTVTFLAKRFIYETFAITIILVVVVWMGQSSIESAGLILGLVHLRSSAW